MSPVNQVQCRPGQCRPGQSIWFSPLKTFQIPSIFIVWTPVNNLELNLLTELIFSQYQIKIKKINKIKTFSYLPTQFFFREVTGNTHIIFLGVITISYKHWYGDSLQILVATRLEKQIHSMYILSWEASSLGNYSLHYKYTVCLLCSPINYKLSEVGFTKPYADLNILLASHVCLQVFRARDPGLVQLYSNNTCPAEWNTEDWNDCMDHQLDRLGSRRQLARMVLKLIHWCNSLVDLQ